MLDCVNVKMSSLDCCYKFVSQTYFNHNSERWTVKKISMYVCCAVICILHGKTATFEAIFQFYRHRRKC